MNRRSFFGWIGSALAGCVLARTPLAGKYGTIVGPLDTTGVLGPELQFGGISKDQMYVVHRLSMVNDGEFVRSYINGKLVESRRTEPDKWYFSTIQDYGDWDMTPIMAVKS